MTSWQRTGRTEWHKLGVENVCFVEWLDIEREEKIMLPNMLHPDDRRASEWLAKYAALEAARKERTATALDELGAIDGESL